MSQQFSCSECGQPMEFGFVPDVTYGSILQSRWHAGVAKHQTFFGMSVGDKLGVNWDKTETLPITALRCTACGLLKFYAKSESD